MLTSHNFVIFETEDNLLFEGREDTFGKREMKETVVRSFMKFFSSHTIGVVASMKVR